MNVCVKVSCDKCGSLFVLTADHFSDTGSVACPNCGAAVPNKAYAALRDGFAAFKGLGTVNGFAFSLTDDPKPF